MTPDWYLMILNDPQDFCKQLSHYLSAPITDNGRESTAPQGLEEALGTLWCMDSASKGKW